MNAILSLYDSSLNGKDTPTLWGHSNPTWCNTKLNFLHSQVVGIQKHLTHNFTPLHADTHMALYLEVVEADTKTLNIIFACSRGGRRLIDIGWDLGNSRCKTCNGSRCGGVQDGDGFLGVV